MTRFDRWSRDGMPDDVAMAKIQRDIDRTMSDVIRDAWERPISKSASMIPPDKQPAPPRAASGGTVPISPPSGVQWCDRLMDAQDEKDRIARMREARENRWIEQQLARDTNKVRSEYDVLKRFDNETPSFHREKKE